MRHNGTPLHDDRHTARHRPRRGAVRPSGGERANQRPSGGERTNRAVDHDDHHDGPAPGGEPDSTDPVRAARRARDAELVRAVRGGDQAAFATLFDDWFDAVHDVARRVVRRGDIADEVAQDAFLTAWRRLDSLEAPESFGGWLLRIARNAALNRLEREQRAPAGDDRARAGIEAAGPTAAGAPAGPISSGRRPRRSPPVTSRSSTSSCATACRPQRSVNCSTSTATPPTSSCTG